MRHRKRTIYSKDRIPQRGAVLRQLTRSLIQHGRVQTTVSRAPQIRRSVERLVTQAKQDTPLARRRLTEQLQSPQLARKLVQSVAKKYQDRAGGYLRVLPLRHRTGDHAAVVLVEFV
ncbi:MAG: 50S ribosomal protein L17 [Candidatus Kerfeldbacteria bacterium]|nr:50S ribosomal protein L17 [Candidatus Kerfeldbacteria bacterium]